MATRMLPGKVVECHADLATRVKSDKNFQLMMAKIVSDQIRVGLGLAADRNVMAETAVGTVWKLQRVLAAAHAYHVSADMSKVVMASAAMLDETDVWDPSLAPTGCGIVRFDGGIPIIDASGRTLHMDWLVWSPGDIKIMDSNGALTEGTHSATMMWEFNDTEDNPDEITELLWKRHSRKAVFEHMGRWGFHGINFSAYGSILGPPTVDIARDDPEYAAELKLRGMDQAGLMPTNTKRILHALWLMLNQSITVVSERPAGHPAINAAAKRAKVPRTVTVVELRRREYRRAQAGDARPVEWDHQWLVRGFWRWQTYGTKMSQKKRIWINPYVKGPADRPLVIREQVYDLKR